MTLTLNIIFFITFLLSLVLVTKILFDSNLEKCFKQGRIGSIKIAYILIAVVVSFLLATAFREIIYTIYNLLQF